MYDLLNKEIQQHGVAHENLDESMAPYYSRHSCKQFIRTKPIHFRYKSWVLASATGVPYKIEIYSDEPLGTRVVKNALEIVKIQKITTFTSTTSFQAIH